MTDTLTAEDRVIAILEPYMTGVQASERPVIARQVIAATQRLAEVARLAAQVEYYRNWIECNVPGEHLGPPGPEDLPDQPNPTVPTAAGVALAGTATLSAASGPSAIVTVAAARSSVVENDEHIIAAAYSAWLEAYMASDRGNFATTWIMMPEWDRRPWRAAVRTAIAELRLKEETGN